MRRAAIGVILSTCLANYSALGGMRFVTVRTIDEGTLRPFFGDSIHFFESPPSIEHGLVVVHVREGGGAGPEGILALDAGNLVTILGEADFDLDSPSTFSRVTAPTVDGNHAHFAALYGEYVGLGIYPNAIFRWNGNSVEPIMGEATPVAGYSGSIIEVRNPSCQDDGCVFIGTLFQNWVSTNGLWRLRGQSIEPIVVQGDPIPNSPNYFEGFSVSSADGENVVFIASDDSGDRAICTAIGDQVSVEYSRGTGVAGNLATYHTFGGTAISGQDIVFHAAEPGTDHRAIFARIAGQLQVVAEGGDLSPTPAIENERVVYAADGGLYVWEDGVRHVAIAPGTFLDGVRVLGFAVSKNGFDGDQIAAQALFDGELDALYTISLCTDIVAGDVNGDDVVTIDDVPGLVAAILTPASMTSAVACGADANLDGQLNGADLQAFVEILGS